MVAPLASMRAGRQDRQRDLHRVTFGEAAARSIAGRRRNVPGVRRLPRCVRRPCAFVNAARSAVHAQACAAGFRAEKREDRTLPPRPGDKGLGHESLINGRRADVWVAVWPKPRRFRGPLAFGSKVQERPHAHCHGLPCRRAGLLTPRGEGARRWFGGDRPEVFA